MKSGLILLLEAVLPEKDYEHAVEKLRRVGAETRFTGRSCVGCKEVILVPIEGGTCEYRPLRGPLFVPR